MIFLYKDSFSSLACDTRSWLSYVIALTIGFGVAAFMSFYYARRSPAGWRRTVFAWCAGLCVLFIPMFAVIPALSEQTSLVYLEESDFVRSGCRGSHAFTERYALDDIGTSFEHGVSRGGEWFMLRIVWPGQSRRFGLPLRWDDPLITNLAAFAPGPIAEYAAALQARKVDASWMTTHPKSGN